MEILSRRRRLRRSYRPLVEMLESRWALDATAWSSFAGDAQHTSISSVASQPLEAVHWSTQVDNFPTSRAAHYGGPLVTLNNTVIYPYKTGNTQSNNTPDYHIVARNGNDGALIWDITTPYIPASYSWYPQNQPVLATATNRVYFAGKGGTIYYRDNPDSPTGTVTQLAFYDSLANYQANQTSYDNNVFIETPLTADAQGNIFFGFRVTGATPTNLESGIARISANGTITTAAGNWVSAFAASGGDANIGSVQQNSAPAISNDGQTLYIVVKQSGDWVYRGRLLGLNTTTLATQYNSGVLKDPRGQNAAILNQSTSSPMVAPDGRVFLGVFGNPYNGSRGWMLQFSSDLLTKYTPGGFGWDTTPSIVPASMLGSQYTGSSSYLIFTKYNNYYLSGGSDGGDGSNGIAILDPNDTEVEYHHPADNTLVMKRVLYQVGPTPDWDYPGVPTARREWCINYAAVDPATSSVIVNSSDGKFYRWHLPSDTLIEPLVLTSGIGQPYTMTVIGVDGSVYGIQMGKLFAMGQTPRISISDPTFSEGTGGATNATFVVSLDYPRTADIAVDWATANGSAIAGADFTAGSGRLIFNPGVKSRTITVAITPDLLDEFDEQFFVNLSGASNAIILDSQGQATILDDDAAPTVAIADVSQNEGNSGTSPYTIFSFQVNLSAPSGQAVGIEWATANGSAQSSDFVSTTDTLSFSPGETSKTISIQVFGDTTYESNESFLVNLIGTVNAIATDDQGLGTVINDDDVPSLAIGDVTVNEGGAAVFTINLSNASAQTISASWATADDTATSADYSPISGIVTFDPGEITKTISVSTSNDNLNELEESFFVNLSNPNNGFISDPIGVGSIIDDDPEVGVSIGNATLNEGVSGTTDFTFAVSLSAVSGRNVTVHYSTANGTATAASGDYQSKSGTVSFAAGETSKTVTILVSGDNVNEPDETFFVNLDSPSGATLANTQGTGTILNDDATVFSIDDVSHVEGNSGKTDYTFTVTLSSPSSQTVTVQYGAADGSAKTSDNDYDALSGTLTFNPGDTTKTLTVQANADSLNEAIEYFFVNLSNPTGATIGDGQGQAAILNDDPVPTISVGDLSEPEMDYNTGTFTVYVTLSAPSGQIVTVDYRTENGTATSTSNIKDYIDTFGTITFLPGETIQSFPISIVADLRVEPNETIRVLLSDPTQSTIVDDLAIVTILNDDIAMVALADATIAEGNSGESMAEVIISLSNPSDGEITIDYVTENRSAIAGQDYVASSGAVTFAPGEMSKTVQVSVLGDLVDELDEYFLVTLSNATGGAYLPYYPKAHVDIVDDDTAALSIGDASLTEGNSGNSAAVFTLQLSTPADHPISVDFATANGAASAGSDYIATNGTITFEPGQIAQTVTVSILGDSTVEPNETYFVNLTNPTANAPLADAQGAGTILNDDATTLTSVAINSGVAFPLASPTALPQRSQVVSLTVTFNSVVTVDPGAFTLENIGLVSAGSSFIPTDQIIYAAGSGMSFVITFGAGDGADGSIFNGVVKRAGGPAAATTGNSLADGNYKLTIDPSKVHDVAGQTLSGNNQFGAAFADRFFRMFGDSDGDGDVDGTDTVKFRAAQNTANYNPALDWNGNGSVTVGADPNSDSSRFSANNSKKRRVF